MTSLTIGSLAKAGGVGVETVRFYQRRGLLAEPERPNQNGVRRYGRDDLRYLRFIRMAQKAGFSLTEIGELLALDASADRVSIQAIASRRVALLDENIAALRAARDSLAILADACKAGSSGPCPIVAAFDPDTD